MMRIRTLVLFIAVAATGLAAPTLWAQCTFNTAVSNDPGQCGAVVEEFFGQFFPVGTTTATTFNIGDQICTHTVTVSDTELPVIACPADQNVETSSSSGTIVNFMTPVASDNCSGVTVSCSPASGSNFPIGTTTVSCTATDLARNTAMCTFDVKVTAPIPTASDWMLMLLGVALAAAGIAASRPW